MPLLPLLTHPPSFFALSLVYSLPSAQARNYTLASQQGTLGPLMPRCVPGIFTEHRPSVLQVQAEPLGYYARKHPSCSVSIMTKDKVYIKITSTLSTSRVSFTHISSTLIPSHTKLDKVIYHSIFYNSCPDKAQSSYFYNDQSKQRRHRPEQQPPFFVLLYWVLSKPFFGLHKQLNELLLWF